MNAKVMQALNVTLKNWGHMSQPMPDEGPKLSAAKFENSFYIFIDTVREWIDEMDVRPQTLDEFLELPAVKEIFELLPAPLHLNLETEAELIIENKIRIDEDQFDI